MPRGQEPVTYSQAPDDFPARAEAHRLR